MIEIKQATTLHLEPLQKLFEEYRAFYNMQRADAQSTAFLKQRLNQKDSIIFLAFHQQTAVGFIQVYPVFSSVAMKPLWILNDLFVNKNYRQLGIAKRLMIATEIQAKKSGVFSIKLATQVNNSKAKKLYQSLGYKVIDAFDHFSKKISE